MAFCGCFSGRGAGKDGGGGAGLAGAGRHAPGQDASSAPPAGAKASSRHGESYAGHMAPAASDGCTDLSAGSVRMMPEFAGLHGVFRDRTHAGELLGDMMASEWEGRANTRVLAIPAGGVPVAVALAKRLRLPLDCAVVSKMLLPTNTEVGYGAVAFDGSELINDRLVNQVGLTEEDVQAGRKFTQDKVRRRVGSFGGVSKQPELLRGTNVILADDGLASGFTARVAIMAMHRAGAARVMLAVPTALEDVAWELGAQVDTVYCANVRNERAFCVAHAFEKWYDEEENNMLRVVRDFQAQNPQLHENV